MKNFSLLLTFVLAGVCLGAGQEPAPTPQAKEPTYQGKTLGEWIAQTKDKRKGVRQTAAWALGKIGPEARAAIPALSELCKDKDEGVRQFAAQALGRIGPAAIPALTELLKCKYGPTQRGARQALKKIGPAAVPALLELLKDKNRSVQKAAVDALGDIGTEAGIAIPAIIQLLKDKKGKKLAPLSVEEAADDALRKIGPPTVHILIQMLKNKDESVRKAAVEALENIGAEANTAIAPFTELLTDNNEEVRAAAAFVLGKMGSEAKTAIPTLTMLLKDKNKDVRRAAAEALGKYRPLGQDRRPCPHRIVQGQGRIGSRGSSTGPGRYGYRGGIGRPRPHGIAQGRERGSSARCCCGLGKYRSQGEDRYSSDNGMVAQIQEWLGSVGRCGSPEENRPSSYSSPHRIAQGQGRGRSVVCCPSAGEMGPEAKMAIPALTELLKDEAESVRKAAADALEKIMKERR